MQFLLVSPVMDYSIASLVEKFEQIAKASPYNNKVGDMDAFLENLQIKFEDPPPQFLEFCQLWGGRFPIIHRDMQLLQNSLADESVNEADSV